MPTMTEQEIRLKLKALKEEVSAINMERGLLLDQLKAQLTKLRVGDRVKESKSGQEWEISAISFWISDTVLAFEGHKVLKSSALHKSTHRIWAAEAELIKLEKPNV